jgi:hypothetical protein
MLTQAISGSTLKLNRTCQHVQATLNPATTKLCPRTMLESYLRNLAPLGPTDLQAVTFLLCTLASLLTMWIAWARLQVAA